MQIGKEKASYRLRLIDLETGKSKTMTLYTKENKPTLEETMKKVLKGLREN